MLGGQQATTARLPDDIFKEGPGDVALQQPISFLVKVVGAHTASSIARPTNRRNSRLYSSCSITIRSLRTEYSTWSRSARNRCSGGIEGRPVVA
jgi:hypothetical protein